MPPLKKPTPPVAQHPVAAPQPLPQAPSQSSLSPWKAHCARWAEGCGAEECSRARRVVLGRGRVPADIVFIGEGPGVSEDVLGEPFRGPAGELLQRIIEDAVPPEVRYTITNMVGCMPTDEHGDKSGEPEDAQVRACMPRLVEFVAIANPKLIVAVGEVAKGWMDPTYLHRPRWHKDIPLVAIKHPAAILREQVAMRGLSIQKCVVTLAAACDDLLNGRLT